MAAGETQIPTIPEDLMNEVVQAARAQNRQASDLVTEAVRSYLDDRRWQKVIMSARDRTKSMGLTEDDVPRLIAESRAGR